MPPADSAASGAGSGAGAATATAPPPQLQQQQQRERDPLAAGEKSKDGGLQSKWGRRLHGLVGFLVLHLYTQLVVCPAHILVGLLTGKVNSFALTKHLCDVMGVKFRRARGSKDLCVSASRRVVYLCNHRSWADFFVDQVITGGASYLARLMVWVGTPVSSLYAYMAHSTWYFNRKRGIDRAAFAKFMEDEWAKRPHFGMIAYPEGTRNQLAEPLTLKTGVLQFAFEYKHAVQCVITTNKEVVCNEKSLSMSRNQTVVTCCSDVLDPAQFGSLEDFVKRVREAWVETWRAAYGCDPHDAEPYDPPMNNPQPTFADVPEPQKLNFVRLMAVGSAFAVCAAWVMLLRG